jgi:hypothetical protein
MMITNDPVAFLRRTESQLVLADEGGARQRVRDPLAARRVSAMILVRWGGLWSWRSARLGRVGVGVLRLWGGGAWVQRVGRAGWVGSGGIWHQGGGRDVKIACVRQPAGPRSSRR